MSRKYILTACKLPATGMPQRKARLALSLAIAGAMTALGAAGQASEAPLNPFGNQNSETAPVRMAQADIAREFNIPAQSLSSALTTFGRQSGLQVAASSALVEGLRTDGVRGTYSPREALAILLTNSGLNSRVDDGMAIIQRQTPQNQATAQPSPVAATNPAQAEPQRPIQLVTVVGEATNALITVEDMEAYQATDLADIFRSTPSVTVGGGASGIAQKIYVRGLEDSLINVTVDGAPQTSTLFHHIGRVTIDPELLREVEVQAGAGEATSGAGAIGGAIRFRTKDASDLLAPGNAFGGRFKVNTFTNDGRRYNLALFGSLNENWGVLASYNTVELNNMEDGEGNEILGTAADQDMIFLKVSGNISDKQRLSLSYESREEVGEFSARPNWIVMPADSLYRSEADRDTFVVNYSLQHSDLFNPEVTAYRTESSFRGGRFDWLADISTYGFDLRNTSYTGSHRFTYGVDYRDDEVESGYAIPQPEENHAEEGSVLGIYFQGHTQVSEPLLLSYGLRFDDYEYAQDIRLSDYYGAPITDAPVEINNSGMNLNVGLTYEITDRWSFGLGYAQASRGKEIGDGFTIDSYLWDGTSDPVVDPGLESEKVSNLETSLEYSILDFNAKLAVYRSEIDDVIFERLYGNSYFQNIGNVGMQGFEIDLAYRLSDVELFLGFASNDSELEPDAGLYAADYTAIDLNGYEFNGLGNSRGDTWNLGLDYFLNADMKLGVNLTHVNELSMETLHQDFDFGWVPSLFTLTKPSYTTVDLFGEWRASSNLVFNVAVTNLFDEHYRDHSSVGDYSPVPGYELVVGPWEPGRDIRLSASFSF